MFSFTKGERKVRPTMGFFPDFEEGVMGKENSKTSTKKRGN